jgi:uncharacterized YigZ family protein
MADIITHYQTITHKGEALFTDRGSKFLGFAFPISNVEEVKPFINGLKKAHPKANHFCYAYRLGVTKTVFRSSDDGEPSNSAGKPILGQIDSLGITNVLVVVARYFGGSLLGVPGLINAYKTAASHAIQVSPIITKSIEVPLVLEFTYTELNDVLKLIKTYQVIIESQEQQLFCRYNLRCPKEYENIFKHEVEKIYGVKVLISD